MDFSVAAARLSRNDISLDNGDNTGAYLHLYHRVGADPRVGPLLFHTGRGSALPCPYKTALNEKACFTQAASWNPFSHSIRALTS